MTDPRFDADGLCLVCRHHRDWHRGDQFECVACRGPCRRPDREAR